MRTLSEGPPGHDQWSFIRNTFIGISLLLLLVTSKVQGQSEYLEYYGQSLRINNLGMVVLGSWALVNLSAGAYGWSRNTGQRAYFHQMNFFWNTVNLSIAGFALYSNLNAEYALLSGEELLDMQGRMRHVDKDYDNYLTFLNMMANHQYIIY